MQHVRHSRALLATLVVVGLAIGLMTTIAMTSRSTTDVPQETNSPAAEPSDEVALVSTALRVIFNDHRINQIDKYFSDDFVQHSPLVAEPGRDGLKRWLTGILVSIPDLHYSTDQILVDGDRVITFSTVTGTIEKDLPGYGIKANGQPIEVSTAHIFRVQDNQIVEHWEVVDTGQLLQIATQSPM